jgi:molecular chaperone Hsp33
MVNVNNKGRCAITLDPKDKPPASSPTRAWCRCLATKHEKLDKLSEVLEHYMLQSEQLDTRLILAANDKVAAGLLIQRLPTQGEEHRPRWQRATGDDIGLNEDYNRISILAATLTREELLTLDVDTILHRLFWEEKVIRFEPQSPRFACTCSRERVGQHDPRPGCGRGREHPG